MTLRAGKQRQFDVEPLGVGEDDRAAQMQERVLEFLRHNPDRPAAYVATSLGLPERAVADALREVTEQGRARRRRGAAGTYLYRLPGRVDVEALLASTPSKARNLTPWKKKE